MLLQAVGHRERPAVSTTVGLPKSQALVSGAFDDQRAAMQCAVVGAAERDQQVRVVLAAFGAGDQVVQST